MASKALPKVIVFDLDGCVWDPEMYELWGGGGAPFTPIKGGHLKDRSGTVVRLLGDLKDIFYELKTDAKWSGVSVAVASSCDEPRWAKDCIDKFRVGQNEEFALKDVFDPNLVEIYKSSKDHHLRTIAKKTGVALHDMVFFDNQYGNCQTVAKLGVTVMYTPDNGVTWKNFNEAMDAFPHPDGDVLGPKRKEYFSW